MHTQDFSAFSNDEAKLRDFREPFWNSDDPTESDADTIVMFSRKGLR